jgi:hypothetical protein
MSSDYSRSSQNSDKTKPLFSQERFKEVYPLYDSRYSAPVLNSTLNEALLSLQTYDLFRKYVPPGSDATCDQAIDTFLECEDVCWLTNCRVLSKADYQLNYIVKSARRIIKGILGSFSYDEFLHNVRHSGGATVSRKRSQGHPVYKILNYEVSSSCYSLLRKVIHDFHESSSYGYSLSDLADYTIFDANKIATVPKSFDTDRPIGMEPSGNMFLQLGLGAMIRRRLKSVGIDLNDQSINRKLAFEGSVTGKYSTIDLSSASDTISYELVKELMPSDWFDYLDRTRSSCSTISVSKHKGTNLTLQKFSSMGNGFTFELESLIFYAIVLASSGSHAGSSNISIFGDDIIVPPWMYDRAAAALEACGFSVNHSKSFRMGPFKESCGGNYFRGFDITPIRIKKDILDDMDVYWLYNSVVRQALRLEGLINTSEYHNVLRYLESLLSNRVHYAIPDGIGDGGLLVLPGFASIAKPVYKYDMDIQRLYTRSRVRTFPSTKVGGLRALFLYVMGSPKSLPTDVFRWELDPTYLDHSLPSCVRFYEPLTQQGRDGKVKNKWIMI